VTAVRPVVPPSRALDPLVEILEAGTRVVRVYDAAYGPLGFNPSDSPARFRPVRRRDGRVVPTAYGAFGIETALAEGLLRGVSALEHGSPRQRLYALEVQGLELATLRLRRPLRLVRLHGLGLSRLSLLRAHVIDCPESEYDYTAQGAQALYGARTRPHGLLWTSRQNDSARAFMLWHGRVRPGWLEVDGKPVPLDRDPGLDLVRSLCVDAGVDFEA
jgi:hypothetical protein